MDLKTTLCSIFSVGTFIILIIICVYKNSPFNVTSIYSILWKTVPAALIMGFLGRLMGTILDKPKKFADSDYQSDVLKALKKIDKTMTLADLREKLKAEPEEKADNIQVQPPNQPSQAQEKSSGEKNDTKPEQSN